MGPHMMLLVPAAGGSVWGRGRTVPAKQGCAREVVPEAQRMQAHMTWPTSSVAASPPTTRPLRCHWQVHAHGPARQPCSPACARARWLGGACVPGHAYAATALPVWRAPRSAAWGRAMRCPTPRQRALTRHAQPARQQRTFAALGLVAPPSAWQGRHIGMSSHAFGCSRGRRVCSSFSLPWLPPCSPSPGPQLAVMTDRSRRITSRASWRAGLWLWLCGLNGKAVGLPVTGHPADRSSQAHTSSAGTGGEMELGGQVAWAGLRV